MKSISRVVIAVIFAVAGTMHFLKKDFYLEVMPSYVPQPLAMVYISGFFEVLGGVGLLVPRFRTWAAYGLIALLLAVFPANIQMARVAMKDGFSLMAAVLLFRLPMQFVLIWWVHWCGKRTR